MNNPFSTLVLVSAALTVLGAFLLGMFQYFTSGGEPGKTHRGRVLVFSATISMLFIGLFGLITALAYEALLWITASGNPEGLNTRLNFVVSVFANVIGAIVIFVIVFFIERLRKNRRRSTIDQIREKDHKYFDTDSTL
jgi:large-conductance mechanosensitive channel